MSVLQIILNFREFSFKYEKPFLWMKKFNELTIEGLAFEKIRIVGYDVTGIDGNVGRIIENGPWLIIPDGYKVRKDLSLYR